MSWLTRRRTNRMTDPADGTLTITGTSPAPTIGVRAQSFSFTGVVEAPGLTPTAVRVHGLVAPASKWPQPGFALPVVVDRADPQRVVIRWDQVATGDDVAWVQAQAEAWRQRSGLDVEVLERATAQAAGTSPAGDRPMGREPVEPAVVPAGVPVAGVVVAVRDVQLPPGLAPAGGVVDLTVRLADADAATVVRARLDTLTQRDEVTRPGAEVRVRLDAVNPGVGTLVLPIEPA